MYLGKCRGWQAHIPSVGKRGVFQTRSVLHRSFCALTATNFSQQFLSDKSQPMLLCQQDDTLVTWTKHDWPYTGTHNLHIAAYRLPLNSKQSVNCSNFCHICGVQHIMKKQASAKHCTGLAKCVAFRHYPKWSQRWKPNNVQLTRDCSCEHVFYIMKKHNGLRQLHYFVLSSAGWVVIPAFCYLLKISLVTWHCRLKCVCCPRLLYCGCKPPSTVVIPHRTKH